MAVAIDKVSSHSARATDLAPVLSAKTHPTTGVVTVTGRLTRPGLLAYAPSESPTGKPTIVYRSPKEVFAPAYLDTIKGSVISADHTFKKSGDRNSGLITIAKAVDGFIEFEAMISDSKVADQLFAGVREVSAGYNYQYSLMTLKEIQAAKDEFPVDWETCRKQLPSLEVNWIRGYGFKNNHITVVQQGRAGSACAIDEQMTKCEKCGHMTDQNTDAPISTRLPANGEIESPESVTQEASEELNEEQIQKMFDQVVALMGQIQTAMAAADMAFDSTAFSSDRAGYLGGVLGAVGIEAENLAFTDSVKLLQAYSAGYKAAKSPAKATDRALVPKVGRSEISDPESVQSSQSKAWDKLTGKVSSKKKKEID